MFMSAILQEATTTLSQISVVIDSVKKEVDADRCVHIIKRMKENRIKLAEITNSRYNLSVERRNLGIIHGDNTINLLEKRQKDAIDMQDGVDISSQGDEHASVILLGSGIPVKNSVRPISLPEMEKLPPYTTWVFMDRNRRMTEYQSVVGRRRIYYDRNGGEALICSDSEEEVIDDEEDQKEFVKSEDNIIRMTIEQLGSSDIVLDLLAVRLSRKPCEIKARYEALVSRKNVRESSKCEDTDFSLSSFLDKDLEAAQDSLDNLFCRRCLIFDCKLHGCSQELIFPSKKHCTWNATDKENVPCGPHCYLQERAKAQEEQRHYRSEYRQFLESCGLIKVDTQWLKVQDRLEDDERCSRLEKIDRLEIFQISLGVGSLGHGDFNLLLNTKTMISLMFVKIESITFPPLFSIDV